MNLKDLKQLLKEQVENQDVSQEVPTHDSFEVEDVKNRTNFVFVWSKADNAVLLYNTSINVGRKWVRTFGPDTFPFDCKTSEDYYYLMYRKALNAVDGICFMGYVDSNTLKPIETEEGELLDE